MGVGTVARCFSQRPGLHGGQGSWTSSERKLRVVAHEIVERTAGNG